MVHSLIDVSHNTAIPRPIVCPQCGNRESFDLFWLGDLSQSFFPAQSPNEGDDFDSHDHEGEHLDIPLAIHCNTCDATVMTRSVTITVSPWAVYHAADNVS